MKIIHFSDPHLVVPGLRPYGKDPEMRLRACVDDICRWHTDASFCVITGDLTEYGDAESYALLRRILIDLPFPVHLIPGNCDRREGFASVFGGIDECGFLQKSLCQHGMCFLFLDTLGDSSSAAGQYNGPRQEWLRQKLEAHSELPKFIFMHHPPFDIGHRNDSIKLAQSDDFGLLLKGQNIIHIFFGHTHRAVSGRWGGIGFTGVPGIPFQIPLVESSVATNLSDEPPMYAVAKLDQAGVVVHFDCFMHRLPLPLE